MKPTVARLALPMLLVLAGCAAPGDAPNTAALTLGVGGGLGSQHGNYAARPGGEIRGPDGERCTVYDWDRPVGQGMVLRLRSASCPSAERPGRFVAREISRTLVPIAGSNLTDGQTP